MAQRDPNDPLVLLVLARQALGKSQRELAEMLGIALRTVQRYETQGPSLMPAQWHTLTKAVYPRDAKLAARMAASSGTTLEMLGLVKPPAPTPQISSPPPEPPAPAPPPLHVPHLVDSVLYAAMQDDATPDVDLRPILVRAFRRAAALRLDPTDVADALEGTWKPPAPSPPAKPAKK